MSTPADPSTDQSRYDRGRARLSEIHGGGGEAIVDSLGDLGRYVVEFAFGDVYSRPGLAPRDRALITIAMLAAMGGREPQLDVHLRGALSVGLTVDELRELMIHVAPYAGFPAAINGMERLKAMEETGAAGR
ncbi:MAG: carboxymuconolactone decarboxylase family protein [Solirubrobacteraceae bacterium]|nr:carboxymuconolactone decarboxylase family protein [Patulibacter sp.]